MPKENTVQTFYKDNPDGGDRLERAVYSTADAVQARFDGYFPDAAPAKAATSTAADKASSKPSSSSS
jgi:hypothetical protein